MSATLSELAHTEALHFERLATLGTLAAGLAHEIGTPLATVLTNLDVVLERLGELDVPADEIRPLVEALIEARAGVDVVGRAVGSMRRFGDVEGDDVEDVSLPEAVSLALDVAGHELRHRARLIIEHDDAPRVRGNLHQLAQVVVQLLSNAAQALPEGNAEAHEVRITTRRCRPGGACIEVRDTGAGIDADDLPRIFDRDYTTRVRPGGRHGIGLAVCRAIVQGLGGVIEVESEPGRGTTVRVRLPAVSQRRPAQRLAPVHAVPSPARRGRVLLVDDDPLVRTALCRALGREHVVEPVASGREALVRLREDPRWDVIVCDLLMPDLTGPQLHAALRRERPDLADRMVFVTGGAFTDETSAFLAAINNPVFHKPFRIRVLRDVIAAAVALVG